MRPATHTERLPEMDEDGFLVNPGEWNEDIAGTIANMLGIEQLGNEHWLVINELRDYFRKFGVVPAMSMVCQRYGKDKLWVHNLFGTCLNACYVAGLPNPGEEAKSYLDDM